MDTQHLRVFILHTFAFVSLYACQHTAYHTPTLKAPTERTLSTTTFS